MGSRIIDFPAGSFVFNINKNEILEILVFKIISIDEDKEDIREGAYCYNHSRKKTQFITDSKPFVELDKYRKKKIGKSIKPRYKKQLTFFDESMNFFPTKENIGEITNIQSHDTIRGRR